MSFSAAIAARRYNRAGARRYNLAAARRNKWSGEVAEKLAQAQSGELCNKGMALAVPKLALK
jgi:2-keto-3-deoxy-L-rhamnonate aldolase RhmA